MALALSGARCTDPFGNLGGPLAAPPADVGPTHGEELDVEVEEVDQQLLEHAAERQPFTARTTATVLQVARTIADLAGQDCITPPYLAEALQYQRPAGL